MVRRSRNAREIPMASEVLSSRFNVYGAITEKIVRGIKESKGKYEMPWHSGEIPLGVPTNALTDNPYRGVNIVSLWVDAMVKGYTDGYWATYKQWQSLRAQVRHGERGSLIIFYKKLEQTELEIEGGELDRYVGKASWVFNAAQVDNWTPPVPRQTSSVEIDQGVAAFVEATEARVFTGHSIARYRPDLDCIEMPSAAWFHDTKTSTATQAYHSVLLHELTHWTGPSHRCDREFGKRFGDNAYAFEELVAELGAAFLCAVFKIANEPRPDHAAYVASWLEVFNNDPKAVFTAAHKAQEAIEYLGSLAAEKLDHLRLSG
jgi:antirestriction protein ArdC